MYRLSLTYRATLPIISCFLASPAALCQTAPQEPAAAQPTLPGTDNASPPKPDSPVVEEIVRDKRQTLVVRKEAIRHVKRKHFRSTRGLGFDRALDRPALAGVELVAPLPPPSETPHIVVPTPGYPLDAVTAAYLTPPPPIVCHPVARDRTQPDPRLYKEVPVECEPDNP